MTGPPTSPAPIPTEFLASGGPSARRYQEKANLRTLLGLLDTVFAEARDRQPIPRQLSVGVRADDQATIMRSLRSRGLELAAIPTDPEPHVHDVGLLLNVLSFATPPAARSSVRKAFESVHPGGTLVVFDRVVAHPTDDVAPLRLSDLLGLVMKQCGTQLVLKEIRSVARHGERWRSCCFISLDVLGASRRL